MGRLAASVSLEAIERISLELAKGSAIMAFLVCIHGDVNSYIGYVFDLLVKTIGTNPAVIAFAIMALVVILGGMLTLALAIRIVVLSGTMIRRTIRRSCTGSI